MKKLLAMVTILALISLMAYSSLEHDEKDPDMDYILAHYERFEGKEVHFGGKVVGINGTEAKIKLMEPPYDYLNVTIKNASVEKGDVLEVLGILDGERHVTAKKILVSKGWKYSLIFIRSLPAIPLALYLFFKNWKFNPKKFMFEGREKNA
jgi:hypothetical protein